MAGLNENLAASSVLSSHGSLTPTSPRNLLLSLSNELLLAIFGEVHYLQLVRCRVVCKQFQVLIDNTPSLQYAIELSAAGYPVTRASAKGTTHDLETFRRVQRAYRHPNLRFSHQLDLSSCGPVLNQRVWTSWSWNIFDDVLIGISHSAPLGATIGVLSTRSNVPAEKRFWSLNFDFRPVAVHVDRSQNLLILAEQDGLHFRSLQTGTVHNKVVDRDEGRRQLAPRRPEIWEFSVWQDWLLVTFICAVPGDRFRPDIQTLLYHWPRGIVHKTWERQQGHTTGCLIAGHAILRLTTQEVNRPPEYFGVHTLPTLPESGSELEPTACYYMPRDPEGSYKNYRLILRLPGTETTYMSGRDKLMDRMLTMGYREFRGIYVPASTFLTVHTRYLYKTAGTGPTHVAWEDWGPQHTRYLKDFSAFANKSLLGVSGKRLVFPDHILDFNEYDIAHDLYGSITPHSRRLRSGGEDYSGAIHRGEDRLNPMFAPFRDEPRPVTSLPYRKTRLGVRIPADPDSSGAHLVEEEDGPKIVRYEWNANGAPKALRWYTL